MAGFRETLKAAGRRAAVRSSTRWGIALILLAGLAIRVWLAPRGGMPDDLKHFQDWENMLANQSWSSFNDPTTFIYYTYLYPLYVLGQFTRFFFGSGPSFTMLKVPPILADLGLALVVAELAQRLTVRTGRDLPIRGPVVAAVLLNPVVFFLSGLWGQLESVAALLVMSAVLLLVSSRASWVREGIAVLLIAIAMGTKPQVGEILPILPLYLIYRHVPSDAVRDWRRWGAVAIRLGAYGVLGLAVIALAPAPFGPDPTAVLSHYTHDPTIGYISLDAFNLWGVKGFWAPDLKGDNVYTVGGVPAFYVGLILFALGAMALLLLAYRSLKLGARADHVLVFGSIAFTCLAFTVLTREHERFLYLALPCLTVFLAQRQMRWALAGLSTLVLINMYYPYVFFVELSGGSTWVKVDWLYSFLFGADQGSIQMKVLSAITAAACITVAVLGWRWITPAPAT